MISVDVALKLGAFDLAVAFASDAEITALFGRSGAGKSMTIGLIAGLARPDRGSIVLDDRILVDTARRIFVPAYRRRIGLVFQDARLFPHLSVRQIFCSANGSRRRSRGASPSAAWSERSASNIFSSEDREVSRAARSREWRSAGRCCPRRSSF